MISGQIDPCFFLRRLSPIHRHQSETGGQCEKTPFLIVPAKGRQYGLGGLCGVPARRIGERPFKASVLPESDPIADDPEALLCPSRQFASSDTPLSRLPGCLLQSSDRLPAVQPATPRASSSSVRSPPSSDRIASASRSIGSVNHTTRPSSIPNASPARPYDQVRFEWQHVPARRIVLVLRHKPRDSGRACKRDAAAIARYNARVPLDLFKCVTHTTAHRWRRRECRERSKDGSDV